MTDVADRHWGQSLVRAPTAKDAADPAAVRAVTPAPVIPSPAARPRPPATDGVLPVVPALPAPPPALVGRRATGAHVVPTEPAPAAILQWPATRPSLALPEPAAAEPVADPSLARLARGVQDCARALAGLADRIDALERRLDGAAPPPTRPLGLADASRGRSAGAGIDTDLDVRVRALEGMATDRLLALDHRLRRLETLPVAVGRLQQDTAMLTGLARATDVAGATRADAGPDLALVHAELDAVAELVSSHQSAATQSLERVRTLERAVLEMRRHLERNLAEHTRAATSDQSSSRSRVDALEARLAEVEHSLSADAQ